LIGSAAASVPEHLQQLLQEGAVAQPREVRRPLVFGPLAALQRPLLLTHEIEHTLVFLRVEPIAVAVLAEVELEVVEAVVEGPQRLGALRALARRRFAGEDQAALLVVAQAKGLVLERVQLLARESHAGALRAGLHLDPVPLGRSQFAIVVGALHDAIRNT
jgi:hypothetical protein